MNERRTDSNESTPANTSINRVGGRQLKNDSPNQGGGYLDICSILNAPYCDELKKLDRDDIDSMGLPPWWVKLVDILGPGRFFLVWSYLRDYTDSSDRVRIPSTSRVERFFRNNIILEMDRRGKSFDEIHRELKKQGYHISSRVIGYVVAKSKQEGGDLRSSL